MINEKRVASSIAIVTDDDFFLVDIGPGAYRNAELLGLPVSKLSKIFLTHFHSDHIGDLGEANIMSWANGRKQPLRVYGPEGVESVVNGFNQAYRFDQDYRVAHHGDKTLPKKAGFIKSQTIEIQKENELNLIFKRGNLKVYAFLVDHFPVKPALGYKIDYKNKIIVITGDTIKTNNLPRFCHNADILFSDAICYELLDQIKKVSIEEGNERIAKILTDIQNYHMNPNAAAHLAQEAEVKKLVLVHITPQVPNKILENIFLKGMEDIYDGEIILGKDRMKFEFSFE